ncbi:hypothetical protein FACS1894202_07530 [Clostridia bacterium]|nr:hypothetical protein FACS1894202_07530 [Clostridia bacterium]
MNIKVPHTLAQNVWHYIYLDFSTLLPHTATDCGQIIWEEEKDMQIIDSSTITDFAHHLKLAEKSEATIVKYTR